MPELAVDKVLNKEQKSFTAAEQVRLIALYLPQYHPIPENDAWWGKGFTEWTNVSKAQPLFAGHDQPHLPTELGYYDLRLPETRAAQADLAKTHGIDGFCYYHYWFNGKRLLERPFNEVLSSGEPDFPFCLCWANETWSRRWLGEEKAILLQQTYSPEDDVRHMQSLLKAFADPRYITIKGRPVFVIYRPANLPEPQRTLNTFREVCQQEGLPNPYFIGCNAHKRNFDFRTWGFDGMLDFQPQLGALPEAFDRDGTMKFSRFMRNLKLGQASPSLRLYDCEEARRRMHPDLLKTDLPLYPSVFVSWDNTPRRGKNALVLMNSTPESFERSLQEAVESIRHNQELDDKIVFINAWNEWAEGNHLEPDAKYGRAYLEAVKRLAQHV